MGQVITTLNLPYPSRRNATVRNATIHKSQITLLNRYTTCKTKNEDARFQACQSLCKAENRVKP
ncbi:hypothetical protein HW555_002784 [Spodoptera exigua]|uniref:Uncharacterized protein n=1 Tax=Spodoptera exigua TaxID=7107 RepID=A0A835GQ06_SPOEX|nr:hypothetical protein HW555_002784 [Spodoptera exigua]